MQGLEVYNDRSSLPQQRGFEGGAWRGVLMHFFFFFCREEGWWLDLKILL